MGRLGRAVAGEATVYKRRGVCTTGAARVLHAWQVRCWVGRRARCVSAVGSRLHSTPMMGGGWRGVEPNALGTCESCRSKVQHAGPTWQAGAERLCSPAAFPSYGYAPSDPVGVGAAKAGSWPARPSGQAACGQGRRTTSQPVQRYHGRRLAWRKGDAPPAAIRAGSRVSPAASK